MTDPHSHNFASCCCCCCRLGGTRCASRSWAGGTKAKQNSKQTVPCALFRQKTFWSGLNENNNWTHHLKMSAGLHHRYQVAVFKFCIEPSPMQPPRLERLVRRAAGKRAFLLFAHPVFMFSLLVLVERLHRVRTMVRGMMMIGKLCLLFRFAFFKTFEKYLCLGCDDKSWFVLDEDDCLK